MVSKMSKHSTLPWLALVILLAGLSAGPGALSQEQEESAQESATADQQEELAGEQQEQQAEEATSEQGASAETFVPSEGISEDLSVSFPVDI